MEVLCPVRLCSGDVEGTVTFFVLCLKEAWGSRGGRAVPGILSPNFQPWPDTSGQAGFTWSSFFSRSQLLYL